MNLATLHEKYGEHFKDAATMYSLDPAIMAGLVKQESNGNPNARSHCGAYGLTQVMPATAKWRGYDLSTPRNQIFSGADYLAYCLRHRNVKGRLEYALAAYNCGPGRCRRKLWPKQTRDYVPLVIKYSEQYRRFLARNIPAPPPPPLPPAKLEFVEIKKKSNHQSSWKKLYWSICKRVGIKKGG